MQHIHKKGSRTSHPNITPLGYYFAGHLPTPLGHYTLRHYPPPRPPTPPPPDFISNTTDTVN